ncbi:MAG: 4Fe-4S dicluster domain-containing protein [Rhodospirillales bacterium]|nr:4Fe-4S dicluster domain-containing protein [Rhodospirillales bacterium]
MSAQGADTVRSKPAILSEAGLDRLVAMLAADGYRIIGPRLEAGAVTLGPIERTGDLALGVADAQAPGRYRAETQGAAGMLAHAAPATPWKRFLYPPVERLFAARRSGDGFDIDAAEPVDDEPPLALFAIRPCDLAAVAVLDAVLADHARTADGRYRARRERTFVVAADCAGAGETCFCASMGTGPRAAAGFDLVLSELPAESGAAAPQVLIAAGSDQGVAMLARLDLAAASPADQTAAAETVNQVAASMQRTMPAGIAAILAENLGSPVWEQIAERCLGCANCTMVCPTCFCATVEDSTDLNGQVAERRRLWDSCFTLEHSYIHGGGIRTSGAARYRQWMCHKLSFWHGQFAMSGCVGCGRCITWCPVGIDITEEAWRFANAGGEG